VPVPAAGSPTSVYRPASASLAAVAWSVVTVGWAWLALRDGGLVSLVRQAPAMALAAGVVYAVLVRPAVTLSPDGVRLRNVLRDVDVPWSALHGVSTRFALTLHTRDGQHLRAWAAPASGRHVDARLTAGDVRALAWDDDEPPPASASTSSPSGVAAAWVRREWRRATADTGTNPEAGGAPSASVRSWTARGPVAWLAGSALLTLATLLL
jgi:Bacterial PH domain